MATISLTTAGSTYTQAFNALSNTAGSTTNDPNTDPQPLPGWFITETGGGARDNEQYGVDTGSSNTADTYSYGSAGSTDRALGSLQSGTLISVFGAQFTNNTGQTITELVISFTGEQWRIANTAAARDDRLDFQYSLNATGLATGTWTNVDALDFTNPVKTAAAAGALDGNAAANRTAITYTITGLSIAPGQTFWIRWSDFNASGADDGLAIDDFSITPIAAAAAESQTVAFDPTSVTLAEGNSGSTAYTFTVTRTGGTTGILDFAGTIAAGGTDGADYVGGVAPTTFSGSIPAGQASGTVTVNIAGDTAIELNEAFQLMLTSVSNQSGISAAIGGNATATGTITNDDTPVLSINDVALSEGNAGTVTYTFTVSLDRPAPVGGFTLMVRTRPGLSANSSSEIQRVVTA